MTQQLTDEILDEINRLISSSRNLCTLDSIRYAAATLLLFLRLKLPLDMVREIKTALEHLRYLEESILAANANAVKEAIEKAEEIEAAIEKAEEEETAEYYQRQQKKDSTSSFGIR